MIEVRPRVASDVPALCELLAAQADATGYPIRWPWSGPTEEFIVRAREERTWVAVLAEDPDRIVGHVAVTGVEDNHDGIAAGWVTGAHAPPDRLAAIETLFVDLTLRRSGIGSTLLGTATAWIQAEGRIPVLDVVTRDTHVIDLYRRRGWREVGVAHPEWLPETSLVLMVLDGSAPQT